MKLIVCLDARNGLLFGGRRQSRDRVVYDRIAHLVGEDALWLHPYSQTLFADSTVTLRVDGSFPVKAGEGDWCFCEKWDTPLNANAVNRLYIFRWDRHYPADTHFSMDAYRHLKLIETDTLMGNSHERITMEVYGK